jgi:hypothetical protein
MVNLLDRIQTSFNDISSCFDRTRQYFQSEVSYYENFQKHAAQICSALDLAPPGSFLDPEISQQPVGHIFLMLRQLYGAMNPLLTKTTIPEFREIIESVNKRRVEFDNFQKEKMAELRKTVQQYRDDTDKELKKRHDMTTVKEFDKSMREFWPIKPFQMPAIF